MSSTTEPLLLDPRACEQARLSRDARFDGLFFTAVQSTGIYCRSVCPARTASSKNVRYYASAAAAAAAGFRPCLRCRPERAPGTSSWRLGNDLVAGALRLIDDGLLDTQSLTALAARVGVGERHLRRLFTEVLGASPVQVAGTRRLLFAKQLLAETHLSVTEIALASGYGSVRRFNAALRAAHGQSPRELRRGRKPPTGGAICLRLPYRTPYDAAGVLAFLALRAMPGVESGDAQTYRRHFLWEEVAGTLEVTAGDGDALQLRVWHPSVQALSEVVVRVRRMFDLDADMDGISSVLGQDRQMARLLRRHPGVRMPGGWDGFEIAVRAVLGQQISVAAARTLAGRLVERWGGRHALPDGSEARMFPTPAALADADVGSIGLTRKRAQTLVGVARAVRDGQVDFRPEQGLDAFVAGWVALPGIGPWTAHYIAMRALGHPDAFPAADLILRRVAGGQTALTTRALEQRSQAWRPWRTYATALLWRAGSLGGRNQVSEAKRF